MSVSKRGSPESERGVFTGRERRGYEEYSGFLGMTLRVPEKRVLLKKEDAWTKKAATLLMLFLGSIVFYLLHAIAYAIACAIVATSTWVR